MSDSTTGIAIEHRPGGTETTPEIHISVSGDFDSAQVDTFESAAADIPAGARSVVVDLSGCTILDSAALGSMIRLKIRLEESGRSFAIIANKPFQRQILDKTGLGEFLGLTDVD